ncbi:MAG TPA: argininosuccinate lyase [Bacteroidetes bacterium]|nr:argininosuccinate lyase [Bacteroidota bacterium]
MKLWQKEYDLNAQIENFTVGNDPLLDQKLVKYDCLASIAHAQMLGELHILTEEEVAKLVWELNRIIDLQMAGQFKISRSDEDCHTAIENHLVREIGEAGKKIHTGRSRNDQVLTALRLYYKNELSVVEQLAQEFIVFAAGFVDRYGSIEMPGYTHSRKAMPSSVKLWAGAFSDSMKDNLILLNTVYQLTDQSPLGTGAGYGVPIKLNRQFTAQKLGFAKVQENAVYVQNSRGKFEASIVHALGQIMFDVNKIATDLIFFSAGERAFFTLPAEICTGSSIMPHKKNPDVLELLRAKYHVVLAAEMQLKSGSANLISGYNRDMQLSKEPVMKTFAVTQESLSILSLVFGKITVNEENCKRGMTNELFATGEVYRLVASGVPFREAYRKVAQKYFH